MKVTEPIIVEQTLPASSKDVWKTITSHKEMVKWFFEDIPEFSPEVGFYTEFPVVSGEKTFTHQWKITEVVPFKKIVYDWRYAEYDGAGTVTFELSERVEETLIRVINEGLETFPQDIPEFKPESCRAGWEYFIQGRLRDFFGK